MNEVPTSDALRPPTASGWDFGARPYALEPLTLPHPRLPTAALDSLTAVEVQDAWLRSLTRSPTGSDTVEPVLPRSSEQLFRFRWITGHHVSFILWRLAADALARITAGEGDRDALSVALTDHLRAYGRVLLYTGSSTRTVYDEVIRPSMHQHHNAFSGTWAPDYAPLRGLMRGRLPPVAAPEAERLGQEVRLVNDLHLGLAAKLVPGGRSLLQAAATGRTPARARTRSAIFDSYFLTLRAPVSRPRIAAQLLRRQRAMSIDLATNGLHPGELSRELGQPCADDLLAPLLRVAGLATGLSSDRVDAELGR